MKLSAARCQRCGEPTDQIRARALIAGAAARRERWCVPSLIAGAHGLVNVCEEAIPCRSHFGSTFHGRFAAPAPGSLEFLSIRGPGQATCATSLAAKMGGETIAPILPPADRATVAAARLAKRCTPTAPSVAASRDEPTRAGQSAYVGY